jgi:hypothetical protein
MIFEINRSNNLMVFKNFTFLHAHGWSYISHFLRNSYLSKVIMYIFLIINT